MLHCGRYLNWAVNLGQYNERQHLLSHRWRVLQIDTRVRTSKYDEQHLNDELRNKKAIVVVVVVAVVNKCFVPGRQWSPRNYCQLKGTEASRKISGERYALARRRSDAMSTFGDPFGSLCAVQLTDRTSQLDQKTLVYSLGSPTRHHIYLSVHNCTNQTITYAWVVSYNISVP